MTTSIYTIIKTEKATPVNLKVPWPHNFQRQWACIAPCVTTNPYTPTHGSKTFRAQKAWGRNTRWQKGISEVTVAYNNVPWCGQSLVGQIPLYSVGHQAACHSGVAVLLGLWKFCWSITRELRNWGGKEEPSRIAKKKKKTTCTLETSKRNKRWDKDILHQSIGADRVSSAERAKYITFKE